MRASGSQGIQHTSPQLDLHYGAHGYRVARPTLGLVDAFHLLPNGLAPQ
jgi:hypothetical protein